MMDADRIRQAVETHGCAMLQDDGKAEHQADMPDCEVCLVDAAALAYADLLDGPTDEDVEAAAEVVYDEAIAWLPDDNRWKYSTNETAKARARKIARAELEAVFQARKERG